MRWSWLLLASLALYVGCLPAQRALPDAPAVAAMDPCRQRARPEKAPCDGEVSVVLRERASWKLCAKPWRPLCITERRKPCESITGCDDFLRGAQVGDRKEVQFADDRCEVAGRTTLPGLDVEVTAAIHPEDRTPADTVVTLRGPRDPRWCAASRQLLVFLRDSPRSEQAADDEHPKGIPTGVGDRPRVPSP